MLSRLGLVPVAIAGLLLSSCASEETQEASGVAGADAARGRRAVERFGCGACHTIPGIDGARAVVGPALSGIAGRAQLAGGLPNNAENLVRWIRKPREIAPRSVMPDLGVGEREARDIAAYLYTLH